VTKESPDNLDVVGKQIEEVVGLDRQQQRIQASDRVLAPQPSAEDVTHPERVKESGETFPAAVAKAHLTLDDTIEEVGRSILLVDFFSRAEAPFLCDAGNPEDLVGAAVGKEVAALEKDHGLDAR